MLGVRVQEIINKADDFSKGVNLLKGKIEDTEDFIQGYQDDLKGLQDEREITVKVASMFKNMTDKRNKSAKEQIEGVINYALSRIPLEQRFEAVLEETSSKRSGKEMSITLVDRDTGFTRDLKEQTGTWVVQLISFLLTMTVIKFSGSSKIMVLDEVFTGMEDVEMVKTFGDILVNLARNEDFQIIFVEHRKELDLIEDIQQYEFGIENIENGTVILNHS